MQTDMMINDPKVRIRAKAYNMIMDNVGRNIAFDAYNSMYRSAADLPPELRRLPWITQVINSDPFDAVQTGVRIISTIPLSVTFQPLSPGPESEDFAGMIEKICKWQLRGINNRRSKTVEGELARLALLYDMCAVKVVDLEQEIKEKRMVGANTKRQEMALSKGRMLAIPYDSRDVYFERSSLGLERVLVAQMRSAQSIIDDYGEKASAWEELRKLAQDNNQVTYYDYWDLDNRYTWVTSGLFDVMTQSKTAAWDLDFGANPHGFIPFAVRGGTDLERDSSHRYQGILYPVYNTGAWDIKNIIQTLEVSEVIATSGMPKMVEEGTSTAEGYVNYLDPGRKIKMPPQNILKMLEPPGLNSALSQVEAMLSAMLDKQMVSRILQGGELPPGVAYASLNLVTQAAIGVLKPAKYLTEITIADVFELFLLLTKESGQPLYGYDTKNKGYEMKLDPEAIDSTSIYIDVLLHPDGPTDKQQAVNTANMAKGLGMSNFTALQAIGIEDPNEEMMRSYEERLLEHELQLAMDRERMEMEIEMQLQAEQMRMEMQLAMQQAQQQAANPSPTPPGIPPSMGEMPGGMPPQMENELGPGGSPQGLGFMPGFGGQPPAEANPGDNAMGAGNPMVTGLTPEGEPVSEEGLI